MVLFFQFSNDRIQCDLVLSANDFWDNQYECAAWGVFCRDWLYPAACVFLHYSTDRPVWKETGVDDLFVLDGSWYGEHFILQIGLGDHAWLLIVDVILPSRVH